MPMKKCFTPTTEVPFLWADADELYSLYEECGEEQPALEPEKKTLAFLKTFAYSYRPFSIQASELTDECEN